MDKNAIIKGYITNLGKYNEGELIGKWIEFPIDEDELNEVLKEIECKYTDENGKEHNTECEEYFFTDWNNDIPFDFGEYPDLEEVNEFAERVEALSEQEQEYLELLIENHTRDISEALDIIEGGDYVVWNDCYCMADVAYNYVEDTGMLNNIPSNIANYFDYVALGRDMDIEGIFLEGNGYFLEVF